MLEENIQYHLSRAEEEDRRAETLPAGVVRERHREFAVVYRKRAAECRIKLDPITAEAEVFAAN